VIISIILISSNNNEQLRIIRIAVLETSGWFQQELADFARLRSLKQINQKLQQQNTEYALQLNQAQTALIENVRLRKLLEFKQAHQFEMVAAMVIGSGPGRQFNTIILDRGAIDSIKRNMPVVTADGLVGKILTVSRHYACAQILLDANFRVSVKAQRTRVQGILSWENSEFCNLSAVPKHADIRQGDLLVTSGYSSIFPGGLPVGTVTLTSDAVTGLFKRVLVKPAVNFNLLEEVLVIKQNNGIVEITP
jgi:rod shape-determining protein MreC